MNWNYVKDKILVFGKDDYVFSDMFISIVGEFDDVLNNDDRILFCYEMLRELMSENLIDIFLLDKKELIPFKFNCLEDINQFVNTIDREWKILNYEFPNPNQLFWITTNSKGKFLIDSKILII